MIRIDAQSCDNTVDGFITIFDLCVSVCYLPMNIVVIDQTVNFSSLFANERKTADDLILLHLKIQLQRL